MVAQERRSLTASGRKGGFDCMRERQECNMGQSASEKRGMPVSRCYGVTRQQF